MTGDMPKDLPPLDERALIVAWLLGWTIDDGSDYGAGWAMAMFNAAMEIERGEHRRGLGI